MVDTTTPTAQSDSTSAALAPPKRAMSRRRKLAFIGLSLLVGLSFGLVVAEFVMRAFDVKPERYEPARWLSLRDGTYQDLGIWGQGLIKQRSRFADADVKMGEYVPGAKFKVAYATNPRGYFDEDTGVLMTVNSLGLRGAEISKDKLAGTYRILGLGDSFTFGVGVLDHHTFLHRLEMSLNKKAKSGQRFEVLNAGTQGYNTRDEVLYLEHRWLADGLDPDAVLITFYLNDAYADDVFYNMGRGMGIYLNKPTGLAQHFHVYDYIQHAIRARRVRNEMLSFYSMQFFQDPDMFFSIANPKKVDWYACTVAFQHAVKLADKHDLKIAVVIFPELQNLDGDYPFAAIHDLVRRTCESMGLPVLDLLDSFRGKTDRDLWVHPSDHHPNEVAHAIAAESIETFLRDRVLP